ncbi:rubrerythrin-like domain-containing protein [Halobium salinum]|uniref:Rubrerythrin-like domain-containing protein n=1 Tax=Halobium salinum TaxID=1364940 RepID=A0ABD5P6H5_9EURY|nr:rubrerythrin-like domain-containing protein [Halobium salinum]
MSDKQTPNSTKHHHTYECLDCGHRTRSSTQPGACPDCGGEMKNIGVASEQ